MSYNILNKNVNFQGATKGTVEDLVDTHTAQAISGSKDFNVLTGSNTHVLNTLSVATHAFNHAVCVAGAVSASLNISASAFYANGVLLGGGSVSSVANGADNRIATFSSTDALNGEANLTFDGSVLDFKATSISGSGNISGSAFYGTWDGGPIPGAKIQLGSNGGLVDSGGLKLNAGVSAVGSLNTADKILLFDADDSDNVKRTTAGDIANLFSAAVTSYSGDTDNRVITSGGSKSLVGEANLTFDGSTNKLTVNGDVSGSGYVSASFGWFGTKVTAADIELGDATGLAGAGLVNNGGELDVQVSGAIKIASDKVGITGSFAGDGLSYSGGVDSVSSIGINLAASNSGLSVASDELKINLNSVATGTPLYSADHIIFVDADDAATKKSSWSNFAASIAGDGLINDTGRLAVQTSGAVKIISDKVAISGSIAGNGLEYAGGVDSISALEVKVSDFMSNGSNNRILTAGDANSINAETNLTFDGSILSVTGLVSGSSTLQVGSHITGSGQLIFPNLASGSVAGPGSYLGLSTDGSIILTSSVGGGVSAVANGADDRIATFSSADALNGEANLTFSSANKLTVNGDVSGSGYVSASFGWFGTKVTAAGIELGDATGIAGSGLTNNGGELDIQVSGAIRITSDKIGLTGSLAGNGLEYSGGIDSISALEVKVSDFMSNGANNRVITAGDANSMNAESNLTFDGTDLGVSDKIFHIGDVDTFINFTDDDINFQAGGVNFLDFTEDTQNEVTFNEGGVDVDFRVETADESHMLFIEGSSNRMSIGDNTGSPGATLEIKNHASAGATGVPLLQLNNNDTDQQCLDINAGNIDANVVNITANDVTTARVLAIGADGLTTGNAFYVDDNSSNTGTRNTALIIQNHTGAINAQALAVQSDGGKTGVKIDKNYSDLTEASVVGLNIDWDKTGASTSDNTMYGIQLDMDNTTATNGLNTMYGIHVTPTLTHAANAGTPIVYGAYFNAQGSANGTSLAAAAKFEAGGADSNWGIIIDCEDGGTDLRIESSADSGDYFQIQTTTNGATTLTTRDAVGSLAHLTCSVDGDMVIDVVGNISLDADGGSIFIKDNNSDFVEMTRTSIQTDAVYAGGLVFSASAGPMKLDSFTGEFLFASASATKFSIGNSGNNAILQPSGDAVNDIIFLDGDESGNEIGRFDGSATALLMAGTNKVMFNNSGTYINSSTNSQLDIVADGSVVFANTSTTVFTPSSVHNFTGNSGSAVIPITATYQKIDANGSGRIGMRFAGAGSAGQFLIVENVGGENVTFDASSGTALITTNADNDTMMPGEIFSFVSNGSAWFLIGGNLQAG